MNTTDSSSLFCAPRFLATLRRDWRMERSGWLLRILAMFGVMTLFALVLSWFLHSVISIEPGNSNFDFIEAERTAMSFLCWALFSLFTCLGASLFCHGYATPGQRLNQLMSPSSTLEKFMSRFLICIIGVTLAGALCWELADWIRVWVMSAYYIQPVAAHVSVINAIEGVRGLTDMLFSGIFSLFTWQSIYALGSTLWPRNSFLKTMGAICVLEFIFGFVIGFMTSWLVDPSRPVTGDLRADLADMSFVINVCMAIVMLFCYITAYFRMREEETIQRM